MKKIRKKFIVMTLIITIFLSASIVVASPTSIKEKKSSEIKLLNSAELYGQVFGIQDENNNSISAKPLENAMVIITCFQGSISNIINEDGTLRNISWVLRPEIPHIVYTNEKGEYSTSFFMHFGKYRVIAVKEGYIKEIKGPFNIKKGDKLNIDFILDKKSSEISYIYGNVYEIYSYNYFNIGRITPLENVKITATLLLIYPINASKNSADIHPVSYITYTDKNGYYKLRLKPGKYKIKATKKGYTTDSDMLFVSKGCQVRKNFKLEKISNEKGWLYGNVWEVSQSGNISILTPLKNAKITIYQLTPISIQFFNSTHYPKQIWVTHTDRNGNYNISLQAGKYVVTASKKGYISSTKIYTSIFSAKGTIVNFKLSKIYSLINLTSPFPINITKDLKHLPKPVQINKPIKLQSVKCSSLAQIVKEMPIKTDCISKQSFIS